MMLELRLILVFMSWTALIECQIEPFVVGGPKADISQFPHSVYVYIDCFVEDDVSESWICGGSIVNELIILTAAHCIYRCSNRSVFTVSVGHAQYKKGEQSTVLANYVHPLYEDSETFCDIALERLKTPLKFGEDVKRIALMQRPPYHEKAQIAGWGMIDDKLKILANHLKYVDQYVWKTWACEHVIPELPKGAICASSNDVNAYSSRGDSGSALVVRGYIQIGIVSYKIPSVSRSLVIYTDTGYFYKWIEKNAKSLYCSRT